MYSNPVAQCVELVTVNHDFTEWYKPYRDPNFKLFMRFHAFKFQTQSDEERSLHEFREYETKVRWVMNLIQFFVNNNIYSVYAGVYIIWPVITNLLDFLLKQL